MVVSRIRPDLSRRPLAFELERAMRASPPTLYQAWTTGIERWFARPGSAMMEPVVDTTFFFETEFEGGRHAHYGRFLELEPDRLVELTWVTHATGGFETIVRVELTPLGSGTMVRLRHSGFPDPASKDGHEKAWPIVLAHQDEKLSV
jgi:uncharacterized protein YndB with AHSA1/START domain